MNNEQYCDSTGQSISVGDKVNFRGSVYTIAAFYPTEGRNYTARIEFVELQNTDEPADELSVDKLVL